MSTTKNLRKWIGFDLSETFRLTAEISSLILIFGFIVSAAINQIVFAGWGFNFLALASPTDVLMSGLSFAFDVIPSLILVGLLALAFTWIAGWGEAKIDFPRGALVVAGIQAALGILWYYTGFPMGGISDVIDDFPQSLHTAFEATLAGLTYGTVCFVLCATVIVRSWRTLSLIRRVELTSLALVGIFLAYHSAGSLLSIRQDFGYHPRPIEIVNSTQDHCAGGQVQLLWGGSDHIVGRCLFPSEEVFALPSDNTLRYQPFHHALPMCDPPRWPLRWKCWKTR